MTGLDSHGWQRGALIGLGAFAVVLSILVFMTRMYAYTLFMTPASGKKVNFKNLEGSSISTRSS